MQKCPHQLLATAALNGDEREINSTSTSSNKAMQTSNLRNPPNNHLGLMYGDAQHRIQY